MGNTNGHLQVHDTVVYYLSLDITMAIIAIAMAIGVSPIGVAMAIGIPHWCCYGHWHLQRRMTPATEDGTYNGGWYLQRRMVPTIIRLITIITIVHDTVVYYLSLDITVFS